MPNKLTVRKNWFTSFDLMVRKPVIILPFFIIAFLEGLALELIYFSPRKPLSYIVSPIIRKFFGEIFVHYPYNLSKLPKLFYYSQMLIYIFAGVFLTALSINIIKNIKENLLLKTNALIKNAAKRYSSLIMFGIIAVALMFLIRTFESSLFSKLMQAASDKFPQIPLKLYSLIYAISLFLSNAVLQTFLVLALPIIVIRKKSLLKALGNSIALGFRNFFGIFALIFLPFAVYLPVGLLRTYSVEAAQKTFPEITIWIVGAGILITALVECFIIVCVTQFLMEDVLKRS